MTKGHDEQEPEYFSFLCRLIQELIAKSTHLRFNSSDDVDRYAVMLYASLIELANSTCHLISERAPTGSRTLTRMAFEGLVDLTNLANDRDYVNNLKVRDLKEWQKTFRLAETGNPFFAGLTEVPGFEEEQNARADELKELVDAGFSQLSAEARFTRAGMKEVYEGVYSVLCSDSHNSLRGLTQRHLKVIDETTVELHILREFPMDDQLPVIDALCGILISASKITHQHFGDGEEIVATLEKELSEIRQRNANHNL